MMLGSCVGDVKALSHSYYAIAAPIVTRKCVCEMTDATTATNATAPTVDRYTTALCDIAGLCSGPDDRSGGLDQLVAAAVAARAAYDELDYAASKAPAGAIRELLRRARDDAYESWQRLERAGLPMLQAWQRECLGYSVGELALGFSVGELTVEEIERRQRANWNAVADGFAPPYPSEY